MCNPMEPCINDARRVPTNALNPNEETGLSIQLPPIGTELCSALKCRGMSFTKAQTLGTFGIHTVESVSFKFAIQDSIQTVRREGRKLESSKDGSIYPPSRTGVVAILHILHLFLQHCAKEGRSSHATQLGDEIVPEM